MFNVIWLSDVIYALCSALIKPHIYLCAARLRNIRVNFMKYRKWILNMTAIFFGWVYIAVAEIKYQTALYITYIYVCTCTLPSQYFQNCKFSSS